MEKEDQRYQELENELETYQRRAEEVEQELERA